MRSAATLPHGRFLLLLCSWALAFASLEVKAQAHEKRVGAYVLRSSTVASETFAEATARAHGIDPAPTRAVLNVTVLRDSGGVLKNVRADVRASAVDMLGRPRDIPLRPIVGNGMVSYLGSFDFLPREILDFRVVARPDDGGAPITLEFRDRMWVP